VSWALANVAVARSAQQVGAVRGLLWAQIVGGVLAAAASWVFDARTQALTLETAAWLAGAGGAALLAYLSMFYALEHGRLSIAVPIMSGWAVISTGISVAVLREPVRAAQLAGVALVVTGVGLVSRYARQGASVAAPADGDGEGDTDRASDGSGSASAGPAAVPRWVWASLAAALGFGLLIPAIGHVAPATGRLGSVPAVFAADMLIGLPLAAWFRIDLRPPPRGALAAVALAGLFEAAGFVCIALAGARAPLAVVSPLASLASALTVLYAWVVLRERPHPVALVGAALACAGVIAVAS
jgi:drug/metabolite transporter (DMT)-like permease